MAKITVDGASYEVNPDNNLLQECLSLGLDLPYFCWHPCMGSVGACRQCAVKQYRNADDKNGTLVMACMTPAAEGSIISVNDQQARAFRASVIESLMISHPHDCPVCEEGGECHLQDMTLMSGHNYRRYDKQKVTHNNQYLGPFIGHEMNRCITCYRCVRYYNDYAGGTDLSAQACHHHVYFGRHSDGCLESEFSGNLVEVCPTGVFTDATFSAHYSRKWDLQTAPSVCVGCAVGCNTTPGERYGSLRRIVNRYHPQVNGYFLCDRGRFGYGFVNSTARLQTSSVRDKGVSRELTASEAQQLLHQLSGPRTIGIGSARAGNEANFALRQLVGTENFYAGMDEVELAAVDVAMTMIGQQRIHCPSVHEIEKADAVLIIGEDVTNTAPRIALALRQTVRNRAAELARSARIPVWQDAAVRELAQNQLSPLYILSGYGTRLDDVAAGQIIDAVPGLLSAATAVAQGLNSQSPGGVGNLDENAAAMVAEIIAMLRGARNPLIITGTGAASIELINAAANIALALAAASTGSEEKPVNFCCLASEVNSMGLGMLVKDAQHNLAVALGKMTSGEVDNVIVLENDLYRRAPRQVVNHALKGIRQLAVIDQLATATTDVAQLAIASTTFAEQEGSYVNYEGRAQLSYQVYRASETVRAAWMWLQPTGGKPMHFNALMQLCAATVPPLQTLTAVLPDPGHYPAGLKVPRQSHRYSGRTAMTANLAVNEPKQPEDEESVLSFSMEGTSTLKDSTVLGSAWAPQWNSNQSISKFQAEIAGAMRQSSGEVMLLTDKSHEVSDYFATRLLPPEGKGLLAIRAQQIFGSDELSARSEAIRSRIAGNYAALSADDAARLGLQHGQRVAVTGTNVQLTASVVVRKKIRSGTVAICCDLDPGAWSGLQGRVEISRLTHEAATTQLDNLIVTDLLREEV